jgi:hypothetical protein
MKQSAVALFSGSILLASVEPGGVSQGQDNESHEHKEAS